VFTEMAMFFKVLQYLFNISVFSSTVVFVGLETARKWLSIYHVDN